MIEASIAANVTLPGGGTAARDDFFAWLWEHAPGLIGIDEGTVTAERAAMLGCAPSPTVIDAASAPADRDWVANLDVAEAHWWFADEAAARTAATLVADVQGCRIRTIRADVAVDHEAAWRASFDPIDVPEFGVVRPAWEQGVARASPRDSATIFIEPGLGFGTGLHETTQLCLAAVAAWRRRDGRAERALDYGSGSGILGIAAAVLGAGRVDAIEIDDRVHPAIIANARRNGVAERLHVARALPSDRGIYDLVVANIVAPVLVEHAADLCACMRPVDATLVLSGLLAADVPHVVDRYAALLGCEPVIHERGEWRCVTFTR